ncbi:MAG: sugar-binding transcriptional regulator [Candidatus Dormibacteria bacterium]
MSAARPRRLLVEAARLYYLEHLSQSEVAARLSMTRSNVSRVLQMAREAGIVEIKILDAALRTRSVEQALIEQFGLDSAVVAADQSQHSVLQEVASLAGEAFLEASRASRIVGISWGRTLQAVVESIVPGHSDDLEVVQLVGGLVSFATSATAHDLVRELANRLGARYRYLNSPAVFDSAAALLSVLNESSVGETLAAARRADVALVGIGSPWDGSSAVLLSLFKLSPSALAAFRLALPAGDICGRYYNLAGQEISLPTVHDRVLAVEIADLRAIPKVVGVAVGPAKAAAVLGALHAGILNVLVCDYGLAQQVLQLKASYQAECPRQGELADCSDSS